MKKRKNKVSHEEYIKGYHNHKANNALRKAGGTMLKALKKLLK